VSFSADDIYEATLDKGLRNNESYSYLLIKKASVDTSNAKSLLTDALKHSPDLPATYFKLSRMSFSFYPTGIFEGIDSMIEGLKAYQRNFWWLRSITGLLFVSLLSSFVLALLVVICIRFIIDSPLLFHDIAENKAKLLIVLSIIPLSMLGPLFLLIGMLSLSGLYLRKTDKVIVYLTILLFVLSPFILRKVNTFLSPPSAELKAIVAVNEGRDNNSAISNLKGKNDFVSLFSYGLALRRKGRYEEAISAYKSLLSKMPDPKVYVNLGNCYFNIGYMNTAGDLYKKALEIKPLASAYYNLSQVSKEKLDFVKVEDYFREATKLNKEYSSRFVFTESKNPNRLIIDETLSMSTIWRHSNNRYKEAVRLSPLSSVFTIVVAITLCVMFYIVDSRIRYRAYRCNRCNKIQCGKCAKDSLWGQMCSQCYKSIVKLDELDSRERIAKVLEVQELQSNRRGIARILSFTLPGIAHIYTGKVLIGSLLLWALLFAILLIVLNPMFSIGLSSFSHGWISIPSLILMITSYLISNFSIRRRLNRGWL
jgi:tetratricopeptide (TPR) repeat protein